MVVAVPNPEPFEGEVIEGAIQVTDAGARLGCLQRLCSPWPAVQFPFVAATGVCGWLCGGYVVVCVRGVDVRSGGPVSECPCLILVPAPSQQALKEWRDLANTATVVGKNETPFLLKVPCRPPADLLPLVSVCQWFCACARSCCAPFAVVVTPPSRSLPWPLLP